MNEIQCPACRGRHLWTETGKPKPCPVCGWEGVVTLETAVVYLLHKVEQLERKIEKGVNLSGDEVQALRVCG